MDHRWADAAFACARRFFGQGSLNLVVVAILAATEGLAGCATYQPAPLATSPDLARNVRELVTDIPSAGPDLPPYRIDTRRPLTIDQIGLLAMLNSPQLKQEFGTINEARANLVQARLLPNPVVNLSYGLLISGPGSAAASFGSSLSQSFATLLTHRAQVKSAEARFGQVDAEQLWREWQVAQKARQLAIDVYAANVSLGFAEREQRMMSKQLGEVKQAIDTGSMSFDVLAPLAKATALVDQSVMKLRLEQLKNWQQLDLLLGLDANVRFAIAPPRLGPLPRDFEPMIVAIPERRPDLAALRLAYDSADEDVRAAILGQFPGLTLGGTYNSDTQSDITAGPTFSFALPIFDRNQGQVAKAFATREQVQAKYQASLDEAVATAHGLIAQIKQLSGDLDRTMRAASDARSLATTAHQAYARSALDQRTLTEYETAALERALDVVAIKRQIDEDKIFLAVELGLGLPEMRIALNPEVFPQTLVPHSLLDCCLLRAQTKGGTAPVETQHADEPYGIY